MFSKIWCNLACWLSLETTFHNEGKNTLAIFGELIKGGGLWKRTT